MPTTFTGSGNRLGGGGGSTAPATSAPPPVNSRPQGNCPKFDTKRYSQVVRFNISNVIFNGPPNSPENSEKCQTGRTVRTPTGPIWTLIK